MAAARILSGEPHQGVPKMSEPQTHPPPSKNTTAWAISVALVAIVAILVGAGLYIFRSLRQIPGEALSGTRELLRDLEDVAAAFSRGTIETTFISYAATVSGSSYLQFATLRQIEVFTRKDQASILWGQLELPEVVVSATAPVQYTAYLDLDERWEFLLEDRTLYVLAPKIRFNKPAIDASRIHYEVRESSVLRDEELAIEKLKVGLTAMSVKRAQEHVSLIRETGRRRTEEFVANWLVQAFGDGGEYHVEVFFADERTELGLALEDAEIGFAVQAD